MTDSQILRSKKGWKEYRELENYCKQFALHSAELDNLKVVCKKMEELAADLLWLFFWTIRTDRSVI
ncbi:MAG TPA: hypothetical protein VK487_04380 [Candidatus Bathyarchaeia archaeon]|nr:hypothetical protein [Candidatus Bathyarchaeia archaeon]